MSFLHKFWRFAVLVGVLSFFGFLIGTGVVGLLALSKRVRTWYERYPLPDWALYAAIPCTFAITRLPYYYLRGGH